MKYIVLLSEDTKALAQMATWLKDLPEEVDIQKLATTKDFFKRYCQKPDPTKVDPPPGQPATTPASPVPEATPSGRAPPMNMLIVDLELMGATPFEWLADTRKRLLIAGAISIDQPFTVIVLAFEGAGFDIEKLKSETIDDLVMKPVDRTLFQQKAELLLGEKGKVTPTFLFKQKTKINIEMGKDSHVEKMNEWSFAIRNPVPLANGLTARFYSSVFGEKGLSTVLARVYKSTEHPLEANSFLVYFSYFGITHDQVMNVRKYLRAMDEKKPKRKAQEKKKRVEEGGVNIVVIDPNRDSAASIKDTLETNTENAKVHVFHSYSSFLKTVVVPTAAPPAAAAPAQAPASHAAPDSTKSDGQPAAPKKPFPTGKEISFLLKGEDFSLTSIEPTPKKDSELFGLKVDDHIDKPTDWLGMIHKEDREEFEEFLAYLLSGQSSLTEITFVSPEQQSFRITVSGSLEKAGEDGGTKLIRLNLKELAEEEVAQKPVNKKTKFKSVDAVFIDGAVIRVAPESWYEGFSEMLKKGSFLGADEKLPVFVMGDEKSTLSPEKFRAKVITDFLYKPLDRKLVTYKALRYIAGLKLSNEEFELKFYPVDFPARATKSVEMEEVSEFGLQIKHVVPLRENVFIRFFSPHFLDEQGNGILGRCHYCLKDQNDPSIYHCFFTFFGVTDSFLKHIRQWIREDYVNKKDKGN